MNAQTHVYVPSKSLGKRVARRLAPLQGRRVARFNLERPIISFTFDDCPKSAWENGVKALEAEGWKSTIYIASQLLGTTNHHGLQMNREDVIAAFNAGHEIGGHSFSHSDLSEMGFDDVMADISANRQAFREMGLPPCRTFAYPFGQTKSEIKTRLQNDYAGLRGITPGIMTEKVDLNQIRSTPVFTGSKFQTALRQISELSSRGGWLTLFTHEVSENPTEWGCTPAEMEAIIKAAKESGAEVLTVADAIARIKESSK